VAGRPFPFPAPHGAQLLGGWQACRREGAVIKSQSSPQTCLLLPSLAQSRTWLGTMSLALHRNNPPPMPASPWGGFSSPMLASCPWP
jgi:hypothetical protein